MELKAGDNLTDINDFPSDWIIVSLASVANIIDPHPSHRAPSISHGGIPFLGIGDFDEFGNIVSKKPRTASDKVYQEHLLRYDLDNKLIGLGRVASIGKVIKFRTDVGKYIISPTIAVIEPKQIVPEYLYQLLKSEYVTQQFSKILSGSTRSSVGMNVLRSIKIVFPQDIVEQNAIGQALTNVDSLIIELQRLIDKKCNIKQGTMRALLSPYDGNGQYKTGWIKQKLGDNAFIKARIGWQGLTTAEYQTNGEYCLITGTEFEKGTINWNECNYIEKARYAQDRNIQVKPKDVLVTKDGTIGKIAFIDDLPLPATLNSGVFVIRPIANAFDPKFFFYILMSSLFKAFLNQLSAGSTINHLYQKDIVGFEYFLPQEITQQKEIVKILSDMDRELLALKAKLEKTKQLKQGMMQKLLTGQIRLTQASEESKPRHNEHYNEAVVLSVITDRFASEQFPLGSFRRTKFSYLLHRYCKESTEKYLKKVAGPYNPSVKYGGAEKIALTKKYVVELPAKSRKFLPSENIREAKEYFNKWYPEDVLTWLENNFKYSRNEELELFTTVDMAMQELKENGKPVSTAAVRQIISSSKEWKAKLNKQIFSDINIGRTINECNRIWSEI